MEVVDRPLLEGHGVPIVGKDIGNRGWWAEGGSVLGLSASESERPIPDRRNTCRGGRTPEEEAHTPDAENINR